MTHCFEKILSFQSKLDMAQIKTLISILIGLELVFGGQLEINDQILDFSEDQVIEVFLNTFGQKIEALR